MKTTTNKVTGAAAKTLSFIGGIVVAMAIPLIILAVGVVNFAASKEAGPIEETLAPWAYRQSMERWAPATTNPFADDADALQEGLNHYAENCVLCHGAPGAKPAEFAEGLNPPPPHLTDEDIQKQGDGELFWTVKHGIRLSGMPAFAPTHSDEKIWKIVAFVRQLPRLTPEQKEALKQPSGEHHSETPAQAAANTHTNAARTEISQ